MVEKGSSLSLGIEFEKQIEKENLIKEKILGLSLGNVIKYKKNDSLPLKSKLSETRSDSVGNIFYKIADKKELTYNFSS